MSFSDEAISIVHSSQHFVPHQSIQSIPLTFFPTHIRSNLIFPTIFSKCNTQLLSSRLCSQAWLPVRLSTSQQESAVSCLFHRPVLSRVSRIWVTKSTIAATRAIVTKIPALTMLCSFLKTVLSWQMSSLEQTRSRVYSKFLVSEAEEENLLT